MLLIKALHYFESLITISCIIVSHHSAFKDQTKMAKKRFSRSGLQQLENNFEIVEILLKSSASKLKKLEKELIALEEHRINIVREKHENKHILLPLDFYQQRMLLCDRDIADLKEKLLSARQDNHNVGLCFKRCYYLMYGKPKLSDLK
jgi:hypothetical protein